MARVLEQGGYGRRGMLGGAPLPEPHGFRAARILSAMARLPVKKTYKLFIGGAFPRSESGRTYEAQGQNVALASRKDARDAVSAARAAQAQLGRRDRRTTAGRCSTGSRR